MNRISIRGGTKTQKQISLEAVEFAIQEMMPRYSSLDIFIQLKSLGKEYHGFCSWDDDSIRPRSFTIELNNKQSKKDLIDTIMHEMVHVKQYAKGELKERHKGGYKQLWMDEDHTDTPYSRQPWEKEAYRMQTKLARKFNKNK